MDSSDLLMLLAAAVGFVGFCLMTAAFIMVARRGGWRQAMEGDPDGRWPLPKRLMVTGAALCTIFGLLASITNVLPWRDSSQRSLLSAALGAVLAAALIGITALIQRWRGR